MGKPFAFHQFPNDVKLKKQWLHAIRRKNFDLSNVTKNTRVCSEHFKKDDYQTTLMGERSRLKRGSVPSIFHWTQSTTPSENAYRGARVKKRNEPNITHREPVQFLNTDNASVAALKMMVCVVPGCESNALRIGGPSVSFFSFPKDEERRALWIQRINPALSGKPKSYLHDRRVCGLHFTEDQFINVRRLRLTYDAVPTLELPDLKPKILRVYASGISKDSTVKRNASDGTYLVNTRNCEVKVENFETSPSAGFEMVNIKLETDISSDNEMDIKSEPTFNDEDDAVNAHDISPNYEHEIRCQVNSSCEDNLLRTHNSSLKEECEINYQVSLRNEVDPLNTFDVSLSDKVKIECQSVSNHEDDSLSTQNNCNYGVHVKEEKKEFGESDIS
ncbi:uncharacterized protein [Periplaneta americana]|uniref:uncharacterized protein isoform X2 n=1 Tax=Periplaneta americana TaxID=6978 RepID=UPI0037E866AC